MKFSKKTNLIFVLVFLALLNLAIGITSLEVITVGDLGRVYRTVSPPLQGSARKDFTLTSTSSEKIPIGDGQSIYFVATPITGDVDLYVSTQGPPQVMHGYCTNCVGEGVTAQGEIIELAYNSLNYPVGDSYTFYIAVQTHDNAPSSFTFTTYLSDEGEEKRGSKILLEATYPQTGQVKSKKYTYFKYSLESFTEINGLEDGDDIVITVTPVGGGDPDIYASSTNEYPDKNNYQWKSAMWSSDQIVISKSDENYPANHIVYIGIYGFSSTVDTYFIVQAHLKRNYAIVLDGAAQNYNGKRETQHFKFILAKKQEIAFVVNPLSFRGDPDIYVTDAVTPDQPVSPSHYNWKSVGIGSDTIRFYSDKPPTEPGAVQWYYIAVKSYAALKYSLMVTTEGTPTLLESGKPTRGLTEMGSPSFFRYFHVDKQADMSLVVEPANTSPINVYISNPSSNIPKPDSQVNDAVASQSGLRTYYNKARAAAGTYHFGAFPTSFGPQNFTITVSSNSTVTTLRDGISVPFNSIARDGYRYYMFQVADKLEEDIFILITPYSGSEVDLYVSTGDLLTRPTRETCGDDKCWIANSYRSDSIIIRPSDSKVTENTRTFFIGVAGRTYDENRFRIVAFTSDSDIELIDGQPSDGSVEVGKTMYFKFWVENNEQLDVELYQSAPAEDMNVDLYGSLLTEKPDRNICKDRSFHCQSSNNIGANDLISLNVQGAPRWYYIGVTGIASPDENLISFRITARAKFHVIDHYHASLIEQTPKDTLQKIQVSNVYSISKFIVISNTLISGRTEMYLNPNYTGVSENVNLYSDKGWPGNVLVIKNEGENPTTKRPMADYFKTGEWSIGVKALANSNYITSAQQSTFFLWDNFYLDNLPHLSGVPKEGKLHFQYYIKYKTGQYGKPATEDLNINLRVLSGMVNVYIGRSYFHEPVRNNNDWNATLVAANRMMVIPKEKLTYGRSVYITIEGAAESDVDVSIFEITVSTPSEPSYLNQDQPVLTRVNANQPKYYKMLSLISQNDHNMQNVEIVAESCDWNPPPTLFFSTVYPKPNATHKEVQSTSSHTSSQLTTVVSDGSQIFYIQAFVPEDAKETTYSITGTTSDFIRPILSYKDLDATVTFEGDNAAIKLTVPKANRPKAFQDKPLRYTFYVLRADTEGDAQQMSTECGVKTNMKWKGVQKENDEHHAPITHTLLLDASKVWQINVLVDDELGMASVYNGIYYKDGQIYTSYPGVLTQMEISIGSILMLIVFTIFMMYFHVGAFINLVFLGKDGSDIIPQKSFWVSIPFLFIDGILFVFTCGRRSTSYDPMDSANVNYDGETYDDTPADVTTEDKNDTGGYGGI